MAVTDFGRGRFAESDSRQARSYSYQHQAQDDDDYGGFNDRFPEEAEPEGISGQIRRLSHYVGMLLSVALLVGLVVWGYNLISRDVSGVPVIRAVTGDARTAPEEPGGELGQNAGLAVNEVAAGVDVPPNAEIAIAPAPTALQDDDIAMGELTDPAALVSIDDRAAPTVPAEPVVAISDADAAAGVVPDAGTDLAALGIVSEGAEGEGLVQAEPEAAASPPIEAGPRPARRPATIVARAQAAPAPQADANETAPAEAAAEIVEPDPAPEPARVASGSSVVQLGAFDSGPIADKEWGRISGRFSNLFAGKSQVVQTTQKNGRTFHRLRVAGFESRDDARRFCAALIAEGADCITATQQ